MDAKQVVYVYNGDQETADLVLDLEGEIPEPEMGEMITRDGQTWTIAAVRWTQDNGERALGEPALPVMQVFLTSYGD